MTLSRRAGRVAIGASLVVALCGATTARLAADTYPRQPGIRIAGCTFDITLSDAADEFRVVETVDVEFVAAGVEAIDLDLCNFTAAPRSPRKADGLADPCAEPAACAGCISARRPLDTDGNFVTNHVAATRHAARGGVRAARPARDPESP